MFRIEKTLAEQIAKLMGVGTQTSSPAWQKTSTLGRAGCCCQEKEKPALNFPRVQPGVGPADQWGASAGRFFSILGQADSVAYVSWEYSMDCTLKRNRYLVNHAICLTVSGGEGQQ